MSQLKAQPVNALRCRLLYRNTDGFLAGSRFYLAYAATSPDAAQCVTEATNIANHWNADLAGMITTDWTLYEVDVIDLSSDMAASGQVSVSHAGTLTGATLPANVATNVEFDIARRYRGGKPRMYTPGGPAGELANDSTWTGSWLTTVNTAFTDFKSDCQGDTWSGSGALTFANISFVQGYDKNQPPSGTWRGPGYKYPPLYRDTPVIDPVSGFSAKAMIGSQRRRRSSTTP